jgi:hypothetical protein
MRATTVAIGILTTLASISCVTEPRSDTASTVPPSSGGTRPPPSACTTEGAAALASQMELLTASGDVAAVSAVLSSDSSFRWVSDATTEPPLFLRDRDAAARYVADAATPRYDIQEIRVQRRGKGHSVDVVFQAHDGDSRSLLGKALFLCVPPSISAWTVGSRVGNDRGLCETTASTIRVNGMTACGP